MDLSPCPACHELVVAGACECPHCGRKGVCRSSARLSGAALLMGLALVAAPGCDDGNNVQPLYGVAFTDDDGDGWSVEEGDCNDDNEDIHPEAEETPGDEVDSNCNGDDDT